MPTTVRRAPMTGRTCGQDLINATAAWPQRAELLQTIWKLDMEFGTKLVLTQVLFVFLSISLYMFRIGGDSR